MSLTLNELYKMPRCSFAMFEMSFLLLQRQYPSSQSLNLGHVSQVYDHETHAMVHCSATHCSQESIEPLRASMGLGRRLCGVIFEIPNQFGLTLCCLVDGQVPQNVSRSLSIWCEMGWKIAIPPFIQLLGPDSALAFLSCGISSRPPIFGSNSQSNGQFSFG
jgi:hypothetical protein